MVEAPGESTHVWSHKVRATLLRSLMRHFAQGLEKRNFRVDDRRLDRHGDKTLADGRCAALQEYRPQRLIGVAPGDFRVRQQFEDAITLIASYAINTGPRGLKPSLEWVKLTSARGLDAHQNQVYGRQTFIRQPA